MKVLLIIILLSISHMVYGGGNVIRVKVLNIISKSELFGEYELAFEIVDRDKAMGFRNLRKCKKIVMSVNYDDYYYLYLKLRLGKNNFFPDYEDVKSSLKAIEQEQKILFLTDIGFPYVEKGDCHLFTKSVKFRKNTIIPMMNSY